MFQTLLIGLGQIGWMEGLIVLVIVLILFGGRKIPQLAKDLGSGIREFKKSLNGTASELTDYDEEEEDKASKKKTRSKKG